jgi:LCP family protein required for cell wall assembly
LTPDEPLRSRSEVQAELRQERKEERKESKRQHRWRRRTLWSLASLIFVAAAGAGGIYLYADYRFDQIKKIHSKHLVKQSTKAGAPFNILIAGSDSRAFVDEDNSTQVNAFGNESDAGGQRSDVTMVARFVPATKSVTVLSIPRDLWVDIPGDSSESGYNRINAAFDKGPDLLVQTIEQVLHIPINHYLSVDFPGFSSMVNALGGITMDFPTEVKDSYTGLDVTTLGCQVVNGTTALQLVRSRHLYYKNSNGYWEYDGLSDFSRIQRQDAFFRAVLEKINQSITNPLAINGFISAAVGNLTIDDTLTQSDLFHIATAFRGLANSHLVTETLPTVSYETDGGAAVLKEAQPFAENIIKAFNAIGVPKPKPSTSTTTTTQPALPHSQVSVQVFNASTVNDLAHETASELSTLGFGIAEIGDAPSPITAGDPSQIWYGSTGLEAAHTLGAVLKGSVKYVADPQLSGDTVSLLIAGSQLTVNNTTSSSTTTTTTTTYPGETTTTTTIPADVYTNTQAEPWNPYPCTLGSSSQAAPTTTTTARAHGSTSKSTSTAKSTSKSNSKSKSEASATKGTAASTEPQHS